MKPAGWVISATFLLAFTALSSAQFCSRLVSLAPSLTESAFALGLGDRVVGVSRFCNFPPAVEKLPRVGGYFDLDFEAVLRLKPSLVLTLDDHVEARRRLKKHGIATLVLRQKSVNDILVSLQQIGKVCGAEGRAKNLTDSLQRVLAETLPSPQKRPRVLISVSREVGSGKVSRIFVAGRDGYLDELLQLAGGVNAYEGSIAFPEISREGILRLDPDYIFDLVPETRGKSADSLQLLSEWNSLTGLRAASRQQIQIFTADYVSIPGPRFVLLLDAMKTMLGKH